MMVLILLLSMIFFVQSYQSSSCNAPVGYYCPSMNNPTQFLKCGKGKYQDEKGQTSCKSCKDGEYNIGTGQSKCNVCPVGHSCYWKDRLPLKCRGGQYQEKRGKTYCQTCPTGRVCSSTGPVLPKRNTRAINSHNKLSAVRIAAIHANAAYYFQPSKSRLMNRNEMKGFVKYDSCVIVVSFQGSKSIKDWLKNIKIKKRSFGSCQAQNCKVHTGFYESYFPLKCQMFMKVKDLSLLYRTKKVLVTGHSLGGAMATLAAVDLVNAGYRVNLITFGSPRVGNKKFAEHVNKKVQGRNLRVTYRNDIVTVSPGKSVGYWHVGQEIHCTGPRNKCQELPPYEDLRKVRTNIPDHLMSNYLAI